MERRDVNLVRTAADLERKYDFSKLIVLEKNYELQKLGLNKVENELTNFANATTKNLEELQNQVDGNITTWFSTGLPTLENYPANEWNTDETKNNHLGDTYYDQDTGYAYRFIKENDDFKWKKIEDSDVTKALAIANAAQDTADRKRQIFVSQPLPPYDVGDLWIKDRELYRCQTTKASEETFEDNDWIIATKYTDDTVANQVGNNLTILSGTVTEIREDVDELNTTMTNTTTLVNEQGEKIGTLETKTSETSQTVDEISNEINLIKKLDYEEISTNYIYIKNAMKGQLINLTIDGPISLVFPSDELFPSDNLYSLDSSLIIDKTKELSSASVKIHLPLNYLTEEEKFIVENGKSRIEHADGIIEELEDVDIQLFEGENYIYLESFQENINLYAKYVIKNTLTNKFATKIELNSSIKQTADEINIEVSKKVDKDDVVSTINLSPEKIKLDSNRLEINSTYFKLSEDGKIESTSGKIGGFELEENSLKVNHTPEQSEFTQEDLLIVIEHVQNGMPLSAEQIDKYDINGDGKVTAVDLLSIQNSIFIRNQNVNIEINSDNFENFINVESDNFGTAFNVSLNGTTTNSLITHDITVKDDLGNISLNIFEDGTILADMTNSEGGVWAIQNFDSQVFTVNKNGQVECVSLTQTSQEKYKKNFEKLENALDIIGNTDIYKYNLKTQNDNDKKHIGFVIGDNYKYSKEITSGENEGVNIYSMVSVCFKAIQEQQEQIKILGNKINQLKEMIK